MGLKKMKSTVSLIGLFSGLAETAFSPVLISRDCGPCFPPETVTGREVHHQGQRLNSP